MSETKEKRGIVGEDTKPLEDDITRRRERLKEEENEDE